MANDFKPSVGGPVPKAEADKWIEKFDKDYRKDKAKDTKSVFYGRDVLLEILSKDGCAGISFFFASKYNEAVGKDTMTLVLVGTKEDGTLLNRDEVSDSTMTLKATTTTTTGSNTYDTGMTCPPSCP